MVSPAHVLEASLQRGTLRAENCATAMVLIADENSRVTIMVALNARLMDFSPS
jgi:hypothetical protein